MVVVHIVGGLGNQLFQYAAARRLAWKNNTQLRLHLGEFEVYILHLYGLHYLNISAKEATSADLQQYFPPMTGFLPYTLRAVLARFLPGRGRVVLESGMRFNPTILTLPGNVYMRGFWQSEKYFQDCETIIRKEFVVTVLADKKNQAMHDAIRRCNAVCLHVRRGDYVSDPTARTVHGVCDLPYFQQAVTYMAARLTRPEFFVFSDDPAWARQNIKPNAPVHYIDFNGPEKNYEDLRLMMSCQHNIISNSTFGWWGAWLNPNKKKIVIAPQQWFADPTRDARDIVPDAWVRL